MKLRFRLVLPTILLFQPGHLHNPQLMIWLLVNYYASPTDFVVSDVTSSSASVSWLKVMQFREYVLSEGGSTLPSDAGEPLTEPSVSIESLESLTSYDVW